MQQHLGLEQQLGEMDRVTRSGFKMRRISQSDHIDILGWVQLVVVYECLLYMYLVRPDKS